MVRIAGVDLPPNKRVVIGLTYIFGIGDYLSSKILEKAKVDPTKKAKDLTAAAIAKASFLTPLEMIKVPVTKKAMVIGAGVAGISCALDLAEQGIQTTLVEKQATIGGVMAQLNKTFPTMDCSI